MADLTFRPLLTRWPKPETRIDERIRATWTYKNGVKAFMANLVVTLPTGEAKRLGELVAEGSLLRPGDGGRLLLGRGQP